MNTKSIQLVRRSTLLLAGMLATSFLTACGGGGEDGVGGVTPGQNGTVEAGAASLPAGKDCGIGGMPQQLLAAINAARAQARMCGSTSMPAAPAIGYWNTRLADAAFRHSTDMAGKGFFSHTGSDGSMPEDRVAGSGYAGGYGGEILAARSSSPSAVVNAWLGSPGHCQVLMQSTQLELGGACVRANTTYKYYWTAIFGVGQ
jgi:uncharacterized protein YkwD